MNKNQNQLQSQSYPEPLRRISHEVFDLAEGPLNLHLGLGDDLKVVDWRRDLHPDMGKVFNPEVPYLVVDPLSLDPHNSLGYKSVREEQPTLLGRNHQHGRFNFDSRTSRDHVEITREGTKVHVRDLGSTYGTYVSGRPLGRSALGATVARLETVAAAPIPESGFERCLLTFGAYSEASEKHPDRNEDAYFVDANKLHPAIGVFDGVGSLEGSSRASEIASNFTEHELAQHSVVERIDIAMARVGDTLYRAHQAIKDELKGANVATTATVAKLFKTHDGKPFAAIASAGDSRAYLMRKGKLTQLTVDWNFEGGHVPEKYTEMQAKLSNAENLGDLTEHEQAVFTMRNQINNAIGSDKEPFVQTTHVMLLPGDRLLLTSDGIHDNLTTEHMQKLMNRGLYGADGGMAGGRQGDDLRAWMLTSDARRTSQRGAMRSKKDDMTAVLFDYPDHFSNHNQHV